LAANCSWVRPSVARSFLIVTANSLSFRLVIVALPTLAKPSMCPKASATLNDRAYYRAGRFAVNGFREGLSAWVPDLCKNQRLGKCLMFDQEIEPVSGERCETEKQNVFTGEIRPSLKISRFRVLRPPFGRASRYAVARAIAPASDSQFGIVPSGWYASRASRMAVWSCGHSYDSSSASKRWPMARRWYGL
jgi:hypothetical protein